MNTLNKWVTCSDIWCQKHSPLERGITDPRESVHISEDICDSHWVAQQSRSPPTMQCKQERRPPQSTYESYSEGKTSILLVSASCTHGSNSHGEQQMQPNYLFAEFGPIGCREKRSATFNCRNWFYGCSVKGQFALGLPCTASLDHIILQCCHWSRYRNQSLCLTILPSSFSACDKMYLPSLHPSINIILHGFLDPLASWANSVPSWLKCLVSHARTSICQTNAFACTSTNRWQESSACGMSLDTSNTNDSRCAEMATAGTLPKGKSWDHFLHQAVSTHMPSHTDSLL